MMNSISKLRQLLSLILPRTLGACAVAFILLQSTGLSQEQASFKSKPRKTAGLLEQLLASEGPPGVPSQAGPFSAQVSIAAFENNNDEIKAQIDPKLLSKSLQPIKLTVELESGENIPSWIRLLLPKLQLPKIQTSRGSVLVAIEQPDGKTLKRLSDEPAVVSIEVNRPPTFGPPASYIRPVDIEARRSHMVEEFLAENPSITGAGIVGAIFDEGKVRNTHLEFRTLKTDPNSSTVQTRTLKGLSRHSSHVAGIVSARGVKAEAIGMAPDVKLVSYDWDNDLLNLSNIASRTQFSSHSYGPVTGWSQDLSSGMWYWYGDRTLSNDEDARFGKYGAAEAKLDEILHAHPSLLTFVAAGNVRGYNPPTQPIAHLHQVIAGGQISWEVASDVHRNSDYKQGGLDTITGLGIAKNAICIGSIEPITSDRQISMTSYSSWGPTDDGRIKPDLVANGQKLLSVSYAADDAYLPMSGTSMATPAAAGIGALLVQDFRKFRGREPLSSDIKAILIHSADDAGQPGPDPVFGWGALNAFAAGRIISRKAEHLIDEGELAELKTKSYALQADGLAIRVTLVWNDPAGDPNSQGLNDSTPALKDDLDLELSGPDGQLYYPYSLDPANPLAPARHDRPNRVDNVEEIDATSKPGIWTIRVKATKLADKSQAYSLVTSGFVTK
jgi:hypothetical protein